MQGLGLKILGLGFWTRAYLVLGARVPSLWRMFGRKGSDESVQSGRFKFVVISACHTFRILSSGIWKLFANVAGPFRSSKPQTL